MLLLLTLDTFSRTGGIQQFNRCLQLAMSRYAGENGLEMIHLSLMDRTEEGDERYSGGKGFSFLGFGNRKAAFVKAVWQYGRKARLIVFGHVNLAPLALLPGFSKKRCLMTAHGLEVWHHLPVARKMGLARMDQIWSVSRFTAQKLQEIQGVLPEKIEYFPNCLDPFYASAPLTSPAEWNRYWRLDPAGRYLLTVARLSVTEEAKGYDEVIRALPALAKQYPDIGYILAGKSDEAEYARIRTLADACGVSDRLLMPGFVAAAHLPSLYNLASTFVLPSTKEGFGIVFLEAGWWGCPVVAYRSGGAPEALLNGRLGTLVPPGDARALTHAIAASLALAPQKSSSLSQNRTLIETHFGFGPFAARLSRLLEQSLSSKI